LDDCRALFEGAHTRFGRVDCLVNCAAVVKSQSFLSISEEDYDFVVDVNLKGAFNLGKVAVEHFVANKGEQVLEMLQFGSMRLEVLVFTVLWWGSREQVENGEQSLNGG
jgi:NAD(P)-dependent dehydrogenase (short-subunit alcohol dehydrogenase family)